MTRDDYFIELMETVFGKATVDYDLIDGVYTICKKRGSLTHKKYNKAAYERCYHLFYAALCVNDTIFHTSLNLSKRRILENCDSYFFNHGVDVQKIYSEWKSELQLQRISFTAINDCILKVLFPSNSVDVKADDDITEWMEKAFQSVNDLFLSFKAGRVLADKVNLTEIPCVFDSKFEQADYNYAVPIIRKKPLDPLVCIWEIPKIVIHNRLIEGDELREPSFSDMISGYYRYPFKDYEIYDFAQKTPSVEYVGRETVFPITDAEIEHVHVQQDFFYVTCITEEIYHKMYSDCLTHTDLDNRLREKAWYDLRDQYNDDITKYYESLMKSIEDVLERILSMDLKAFITIDIENIDECQVMLRGFDIDPNQVIQILQLESVSQTEIIRKIWLLLYSVIYKFFKQLERNCYHLGKDIRQYVNERERTLYCHKIKKYIESVQLNSAIEQQNKLIRELSKEELIKNFLGLSFRDIKIVAYFNALDEINSHKKRDENDEDSPYPNNFFQWIKEILQNHYKVLTNPLQ